MIIGKWILNDYLEYGFLMSIGIYLWMLNDYWKSLLILMIIWNMNSEGFLNDYMELLWVPSDYLEYGF
jgi:hypothetical protein